MEYSQEFKDKCNIRKHDLQTIYVSRHRWDESYEVVKWCEICGAVVIDVEYDNRVQPGEVMKMRFPSQVYPKK